MSSGFIFKDKSTFLHLWLFETLALCLDEYFFTVMKKRSCYPTSCPSKKTFSVNSKLKLPTSETKLSGKLKTDST